MLLEPIPETVLDVRNLNVRFSTPDGDVHAVSDVSFSLGKGECLGIVGESGSGKSQTFLAALGLLAENGLTSGQVILDGSDMLAISEEKLTAIRGNKISMVFQDPMTSLTPHMRIGRQLTEVLTQHLNVSEAEARDRALTMLKRVHMPEPEKRFSMYPHELSGGMRQRVMIAMALLCSPEVVIADEPTTALDVTVQAQILDLIRDIKESARKSIVLITHDLGVVAGLADRVAVMYAGRIVEEGRTQDIFYRPTHPYTRGLLACMPRLNDDGAQPLTTIPGQPPDLQKLPPGCVFRARCANAFERCISENPKLTPAAHGGRKACFLASEAVNP